MVGAIGVGYDDEMRIHLAPELFGAGARLFDDVRGADQS
jgi:hypothetical protein